MALIGNSTNIPTNSGIIKANDVDLTKVIANNVTVWEKVVFTSKDFEYKGYVEEWEVPVSGNYQLEVYGAQGGTINFYYGSANGGKGGYAKGTVYLTAGTKLCICIGGCPGSVNYVPPNVDNGWNNSSIKNVGKGGYNGGGKGSSYFYWAYDEDDDYVVRYSTGAGGGGCTSICKTTNRGELKNYVNNKDEVLIVAGGGGGGGSDDNQEYQVLGHGGAGGGATGSDAVGDEYNTNGKGGTQSAGGGGAGISGSSGHGTFGAGGGGGNNTGDPTWYAGGGGGAGYYGGGMGKYSDSTLNGGGGGSGYIGGVNSGQFQIGYQSGNGKAKITLLST